MTTERAKHQCCQTVYTPGEWHSHQCSKPGKIERDGKFYCAIHDPVAVEAKRAERHAALSKKWADEKLLRERRARIEGAKAAALDAIKQIASGHNDPRSLAASVLAQLPDGE